eukprot:Gregarina_sp_Poly_1__2422@NODE_164_length_12220_cov_166_864807_g146_i0_p3_GENE_NODE_164_length_12220_cov_166_864807_g146_i0NODE_164_length_12220_cov_166_864807_g146_i0_p3_ORF_typecomplete_len463_score46_04IMCp/PF12314_8/2_8e02IMCp/PF12314_8/1_8e14IMCp/PF12314_8/0_056IMCp/PF12314_8/3_2e02_NODE_164_length_12220_cov_166_864807_g146_i040695457
MADLHSKRSQKNSMSPPVQLSGSPLIRYGVSAQGGSRSLGRSSEPTASWYSPRDVNSQHVTTGSRVISVPSPQPTYESQVGLSRPVVSGSVVGERFQEHRIKVPKRVVREDVYEKIVRIPERRLEEEVVEEEQVVRQRIVEVARPVVQERVVEVPQYEYVDRIVEVPEVVVQERIHQVPKVEVVERVQEVPKIIRQEKIVQIPQVEYRDVPVVRKVEVPQVQEKVVYRERPVPQYVEKLIPEIIEKPVYQDIPIRIPRPVAAEIVYQYQVPQIREHPVVQRFPLYVPKFVEKAVPRPMLDDFLIDQATRFENHVALLTKSNKVGPSDLDNLMREAQRSNLPAQIHDNLDKKGQQNLAQNYLRGTLTVDQRPHSTHVRPHRRARYRTRYTDCVPNCSNTLLQRLGISSAALSRALARRSARRDHDDDDASSCSLTSYCSSCSVCNSAYNHMGVSARVPRYPNT